MPVGDGVICRPVMAERGLSGASHLVGLTVEGWHSQTTCTAMPGKLWFPRNRGTNMTENAHIRIEKACRGDPLRWVLFRLSGVRDPVGFVVHTSAFTAHRSAIPGKLWFLGNFNSNIGHYNLFRWGWVIYRPVIAERGLSGATLLVGLTVEGRHS